MLNGLAILKWVENYGVTVLMGMVLKDKRKYILESALMKDGYHWK